MKTSRYLLLLLCLLMLAAVPVAAQDGPLPLPLSPEQAAALPPSARNDPRAAYGFIHITGFSQIGCSAAASVANVTVVVPQVSGGFVIRSKLSDNGQTVMNERVPFTTASGAYQWTLDYKTSGGAAVNAWPLAANEIYLFSMLLMTAEGKPVWYTEAEFECDQAPASVQPVSGPVKVYSLNPRFDKAGSSDTLAADWQSTGSAKRVCKGEGCVMKLTAKPAENASITQKVNYPSSTPVNFGDSYGLVIRYSTKERGFAPGTLRVKLKLNKVSNPIRGGYYEQIITADLPISSIQFNVEIFSGLIIRRSLERLNDAKFQLTYSAAAKSTLLVEAAYLWVADLPTIYQ